MKEEQCSVLTTIHILTLQNAVVKITYRDAIAGKKVDQLAERKKNCDNDTDYTRYIMFEHCV